MHLQKSITRIAQNSGEQTAKSIPNIVQLILLNILKDFSFQKCFLCRKSPLSSTCVVPTCYEGGDIISCPSVIDFGPCPDTSGFCEGSTNVIEVCEDISMLDMLTDMPPVMQSTLIAGTLGR